MKNAEFNGLRAKLYEEAISTFPDARKNDIEVMYTLLDPKKGDKILGFGEGNGYFCKSIANAIGCVGEYLITDPSKDQLDNLVKRVNLPQITTQVSGAEELNIQQNYFDKAWSFGAHHHCQNQTEAMKRIYRGLKTGGKLVLCDVFSGSNLASHFDDVVAKYCITGHEVKFLSEDFAKTLCYIAGFKEDKISIKTINQKWKFDSEKDLGEFIYKLHALTLLPGTEDKKIKQTINSCKEILGIEYLNGKYELNWPMKALVVEK